mmetsp:Transcript_75047/g.212255  ORF Transcript_75047/g.212255 Transcript_75047/m.212255 type:complete len:241 (+) Transcript_75047:244-966(+)
MLVWPPLTPRCSAVRPCSSAASRLAPPMMKRFSIFAFPSSAAFSRPAASSCSSRGTAMENDSASETSLQTLLEVPRRELPRPTDLRSGSDRRPRGSGSSTTTDRRPCGSGSSMTTGASAGFVDVSSASLAALTGFASLPSAGFAASAGFAGATSSAGFAAASALAGFAGVPSAGFAALAGFPELTSAGFAASPLWPAAGGGSLTWTLTFSSDCLSLPSVAGFSAPLTGMVSGSSPLKPLG